MTNEYRIQIVAISGSLRTASFSTALINRLAKQAAHLLDIIFHDIADIPLFNEDLVRDGRPESVFRLNRAITASDGVLIVTPEYNHGIPGVLKNALDWASIPYQKSAFCDKPVYLMTSSQASTGGVRAQYQLRETLHSMLALVVPGPEVAVGGIHKKLVDDTFVDEKTLDTMMQALSRLRAAIVARRFPSQVLHQETTSLSIPVTCLPIAERIN